MRSQNFSASAEVDWHNDSRSAWQLSIAMAAVALVMLIALFWDTVTSAVSLWWGRSTYNYAFLIIPISAYLIWRKREDSPRRNTRRFAVGHRPHRQLRALLACF